MSYVRWPSAKRIHQVSLTKSGGGISFDPSTRKFTCTRVGRLVTKCGDSIPDDHEGIETLTTDEHNNALCGTCWNARSFW